MNDTKKVFKVGDQVVLNSGGPPMTIEKIEGDIISCSWWIAAKYSKQKNDFKSQTITKIEEY